MTNSIRKTFPLRASVIAVQGALMTLAMLPAAHAEDAIDPAVAALVQSASTVEVGVGNTSDASAKANEYTGLKKKGPFVVGNFDLRGGGAYDSEDPARWRLTGKDLGTEAREIRGEYSLQGSFKVNFGYSELLRNRSDSYQTPYQGVGTNVLTLPGNWVVPVVPVLSGTAANARGLSPDVTSASGIVAGRATAPTAAQLATASALQGADLPGFQSAALHTKRTQYELGLSYDIDRQWEVSANFRHEDKLGLKPMGSVTRATGGDISTTIPDLIDQSTEQISLGAAYKGENLSVQGGYYGSLFKNNVDSMTWSNWALPGNAQTMSTAPSNQFHQFHVTASYGFTPTTRLVANASYARNTQNDAFLTAAYTPLVPVSSLNGLVVTTGLNLKLTSRPTKGLTLSAGYKLDDRDNRTAVNTYGFYDAGEAKTGTSVFNSYFPTAGLGSNSNLNANRPYSKRLNQINLDADYQVNSDNAIKAGFEAQDINRHCNGSWIDCADASQTKENTLKLEWRARASETLSGRIGLAHGNRTVNYNEDAWLALVPAAALSPAGAPNGASLYSTMLALGLTGYGPVSGISPAAAAGSAAAFFFANNNAAANALYANQNRISELPGMRRYNMADRVRDKVRLSADWQAADDVSLQAGVDFNADDYSNSIYGLQKAKSLALNLEGTLALSESSNVSAFVSYEEQRSQSAGNSYTANSTAANVNGFTAISGGCYATIALRNASNKVDPCLNWGADMLDRVETVGGAFTQRGLLGGKLDVTVSLALSHARSSNDVTGGNYVNNPLAVAGAPAGTIAAYYIAATSLPVVKTDTADLRVSGKYDLDKSQSVRAGYRYQYMKTTDWMYDATQPGGLAGVLPTYEVSPSFAVHTITLAYLYKF